MIQNKVVGNSLLNKAGNKHFYRKMHINRDNGTHS